MIAGEFAHRVSKDQLVLVMIQSRIDGQRAFASIVANLQDVESITATEKFFHLFAIGEESKKKTFVFYFVT